jgi:hypothetical protein
VHTVPVIVSLFFERKIMDSPRLKIVDNVDEAYFLNG